MTEIEAKKMFDWLCRRWAKNISSPKYAGYVRLNRHDLKFDSYINNYVPTVLVKTGTMHIRYRFIISYMSDECIVTESTSTIDLMKKLFEAAQYSSVFFGIYKNPFINKNESYEEILVKMDLESI